MRPGKGTVMEAARLFSCTGEDDGQHERIVRRLTTGTFRMPRRLASGSDQVPRSSPKPQL